VTRGTIATTLVVLAAVAWQGKHLGVFQGRGRLELRPSFDLTQGSGRVRALLDVDRRHGLHVLEAGLVLDTRDDEIAPAAGQHHQLRARASPWGAGRARRRWA
jgi:hypothetical protein